MAEVEIIRTDEQGTTTNVFSDSSPYERLKLGDEVEVEMDEHGTLRDYFVEGMNWDFNHFGTRLIIHIKPVKKTKVHLPPLPQKHNYSASFDDVGKPNIGKLDF
jgi:hypothetical protein